MKELSKGQRLAVATVCALLAGGFTLLLQKNRDFLFENSGHGAYGAFDPKEDSHLWSQALAASLAEMPGTTCVGHWIGKDERYAYVTMGCGTLQKDGGKIRVTGDQNFRPVRYRIDGAELRAREAADPAMFENSVRRLFPKEAMGKLEVSLNPQLYRERGLMKQEGIAPPPPRPPTPPPGPVSPAK